MPNYTEAQQRVIDDVQRRREEREARQHRADLTAIQTRQREGRNTSARRSVVQTPRGSSYIDLEGSTLSGYTNSYIVSASQNRPIHADFESSYQYNVFLQSKYKHHHKCTTCLSVFRCGQAKCERTLCKLCDLRTELSNATFPTDTVVRLDFNGSSGESWTSADQWAARQEYTADFEAVERRVIAGTSVLADLAPERSTEEES